MRWFMSGVIGVSAVLLLALPVQAATEAPEAAAGFPVALVIAVIAGLLAFAYFFLRPSRLSGRKTERQTNVSGEIQA